MLQPYPYPDAERIVVVNLTNPRAAITRSSVSYSDYRDWRDHNTTLATTAVFQQRSLTIADGRSDPERYSGAAVSCGVYGVLSYSVSQRIQEIGVLMALGAERRDVLRLVVGQGLRLAAWAVALGIAGALATTHFIESILYNVTPTDALSFTAVAIFLSLVAPMASYVPARRAMAVDPIIALRNE